MAPRQPPADVPPLQAPPLTVALDARVGEQNAEPHAGCCRDASASGTGLFCIFRFLRPDSTSVFSSRNAKIFPRNNCTHAG